MTMVPQSDVDSACRNALHDLDLDSDVLEYIVQGVIDNGSPIPMDEFTDFVAPLIQDCCDNDEDKACSRARKLHEQLERSTGKQGSDSVAGVAALADLKGMQLGALHAAENLPPAELRSLFPEYLGFCSACYNGSTDTGGVRSTNRTRVVVQTKAAAKEAKELACKAGDAAAHRARLDAEMRAASENAAKLCASAGMNFKAAIMIGPFDLPHPAGKGSILDNVEFNLTPGRRYALIGRNGKGKSTLLQHLAAHYVPGLPAAARVEYVSQDVSFTPWQLEKMPAEVVADADVERRVLLERLKALGAAD